jgi:ubiquinone/menaquinone biosynthesis C-methylase UbiE
MQTNINNIINQDWATVTLPDAWPDEISWRKPLQLWQLVCKLISGQRSHVALPPDLPGVENIPLYVRQEFHRLPNGNFSKKISRGYARGFDVAMLGTLKKARVYMAQKAVGATRALDMGCGAGHMAACLKAVGVNEVWGLDPSPYLLQYAAQTYPGIVWVQGVAENAHFADAYFDVVSVCFVLHEIPPMYLEKILKQLKRIVRIGGRVLIIEPSRTQLLLSVWALLRQYGWKGVYFKMLAHSVFEPFLMAWHKQHIPTLFAKYGFNIEQDDSNCPLRFIVAKRV